MKSILLQDGRKQWKATVDGAKVVYEFGVVGGKQQQDITVYSEGKNVGKANETTPEQQCMAEAMIKVRKKIEKGYKVIEGELEGAVETTSNLDAPKPMLAQDLHDHMKKIEVVSSLWYQPKLDGNRSLCNIETGGLFSRNRKEIPHLPHIGQAVMKACQNLLELGVKWVDGELYAEGLSFNQIQTLIRRVSGDTKVKKGADIDTPEKFDLLKKQLRFYMFDVLVDKPFSERKKLLDMVVGNEFVYIVPTINGQASQLDLVHETYVNQGYEGAMVRLDGKPYEEKRSMSLFKFKNFLDEEFAVVGFEPEKHDPNLLGAVVVMDQSGQTFNARPAMSAAAKAEIWKAKESYVGKLATVKFQMRDEKSGIPRFPVLQRFRNPDEE